MPKKTFLKLPPEKQQRILDAAADEFIEYKDQYEKSSVNRIADRAGISVGSIYKYFYDKDDLFFCVCGAGFFKVKLPWYARLLFGAGALLMITPTLLTDGIGIGFIVAAIIISIIKHKAAQKQPPAEAETLENTEAQAGQAVE